MPRAENLCDGSESRFLFEEHAIRRLNVPVLTVSRLSENRASYYL